MKEIILSVIFLAAVTSLTSCRKQTSDCKLVAAKIIRYDCDRVIFQLLTSESIGDPDWIDRTTQVGKRYSNVVSYHNICAVNKLTNGSYDTLYVQIKKDDLEYHSRECIQCQAISVDPPQRKVNFTEIRNSPCADQLKGGK
ncbi:MAG: hypothetical protein WKF70_08635 [Chitinophagaceae bacterium]